MSSRQDNGIMTCSPLFDSLFSFSPLGHIFFSLISALHFQGQICCGEAVRGEGHGQRVRRQIPEEAPARAGLPGRGGARDGRAGGGTQQPTCGQPACCLRDRP